MSLFLLGAMNVMFGLTTSALLEPAVNPVRQQVEALVEQHPERVAQQVRAWLNSGA